MFVSVCMSASTSSRREQDEFERATGNFFRTHDYHHPDADHCRLFTPLFLSPPQFMHASADRSTQSLLANAPRYYLDDDDMRRTASEVLTRSDPVSVTMVPRHTSARAHLIRALALACACSLSIGSH